MKIDTSKLVPKVELSNKPINCENLGRFMLLTSLYVGQILKDKEEYRKQHRRTNDNEGDS